MSDGEPLRRILRSDPKFPHFTKWAEWCREDPTLLLAHEKARDAGFEALALEVLDIADEEPERYTTEAGGKRMDPAAIQWAKHRAETRLKLLACWDPRRYGNKTTVAGDKDNPLVTETTHSVAPGTAIQLAREMRLAAKAAEDAKDIL